MTELELILEKTQEYLQYPSVVGHEDPFVNHLEKDFSALGLQTERHPGVLVVKGNTPSKSIISAHIDRHGLIANGEGELEYAAFRIKDDNTEEDLEIQRSMWEKISARFDNEEVYAYNMYTGEKLASGQVRTGFMCAIRENFVFSINELNHLEAGTPVSYSPYCRSEEGKIEGQLDNAISAAIAYALFRAGFQGSLLLTRGEEVGQSWEHIFGYFEENKLETSKLYVLDTSPFEEDTNVNMDSVILRNRDNNAEFEPYLLEQLKKQCLDLNIPFVIKDEYVAEVKKSSNLGSTELGHLIAKSNGKITGTTVQIATVGYHSNRETATHQGIRNVFALLAKTLI